MNDEFKKIAEQICEAKLASLEREQDLKHSEERLKCSERWLDRVSAGAVGFVIGTAVVLSMSECSHFSNRVSTLESKQK